MPSYHLSVKSISRLTGRSAVAAAAYRSGSRITNERDGVTHDYSRRFGVAATFILAPAGAKAWTADRAALWNAAEAAEKRKDAKVAREYELALPSELDAAGRLELARQFGQALVDRYGVVADIALHKPGREGDQRNWHAHVLTTTRAANENGLGAKTRTLDVAQSAAVEVEALRALWAEQTNQALERVGVTERVDHRSHERRYLGRAPTVHLGPAVTALERLGTQTTRGDENRPIAALEAEIGQAREASREAEAVVTDLKAERARREQHAVPEQPDLKRREQEKELERAMRERSAAAAALEQVELEVRQRADEVGRWREAHPIRAWLHDRELVRSRLLSEAAAWIGGAEKRLPALRVQVEESNVRLEVAREHASVLFRELARYDREGSPERERNSGGHSEREL